MFTGILLSRTIGFANPILARKKIGAMAVCVFVYVCEWIKMAHHFGDYSPSEPSFDAI